MPANISIVGLTNVLNFLEENSDRNSAPDTPKGIAISKEPPAIRAVPASNGKSYFINSAHQLVYTGEQLEDTSYVKGGAVLETGKVSLGDFGQQKKFNKLLISASGTAHNSNLNIEYRTNEQTDYTSIGSLGLINGLKDYELDINSRGTWIQFKITSDKTFSLFSIK